MNLINLFITGLLTQNIVLNKFLGICPFVGTSKKEENALHMGTAVTIVVMISSVISYLLYNFVLVPTNTTYLKTVMFILVISASVQIMDIVMKSVLPKVHKTLGLYLPLITTNCAVLGVALLNVANNYSLLEVLVFSISSSLGFTAAIYIFSTIRERLDKSDVPDRFKGLPIALITAAIMAIIFSRLNITL